MQIVCFVLSNPLRSSSSQAVLHNNDIIFQSCYNMLTRLYTNINEAQMIIVTEFLIATLYLRARKKEALISITAWLGVAWHHDWRGSPSDRDVCHERLSSRIDQ